jgi:hypothetical protein
MNLIYIYILLYIYLFIYLFCMLCTHNNNNDSTTKTCIYLLTPWTVFASILLVCLKPGPRKYNLEIVEGLKCYY